MKRVVVDGDSDDDDDLLVSKEPVFVSLKDVLAINLHRWKYCLSAGYLYFQPEKKSCEIIKKEEKKNEPGEKSGKNN